MKHLALLAMLLTPQDAPKPIRALLVIGGCCHDYKRQKDVLQSGLQERVPGLQVVVAYDPDTTTTHLNPVYEKDDWAKGFDLVIHDECSSDVKDRAVIDRILAPHKAGLPAVLLHCAMHSYRGPEYPKATAWFAFTGLATTTHGPELPIQITYVDREHPITKGLEDWTTVNEELYNNSQGTLHETARALAKGRQSYTGKGGKERVDEAVVVWTNLYEGKTRVFATTLGHNTPTVADPRYLDLVARGLRWALDVTR
ncbi:MAG TPA: ThuA domain-containing protein [Planctomycetota bacterium]|nr:ThuA domain-containing protein [Planctomycetota bacterium]